MSSSRARLIALLAIVLWAGWPPVPAESSPEVVTAEADVVTLDLDGDLITAEGNSALSFQGLSLHADRIVADQASGRVEASGALSLEQQGRRLHGERLEYDLGEGRGALTKARVEEQGVIIRGDSIEFSPESLTARNATMTTCDRPHPHYLFSARRISLTAERPKHGGPPQSGVLTLQHARVTYRNRALFTIPSYSIPVSRLREPKATPFPVTGFSRDDGPFAAISFNLGKPGARTTADFGYRYTTFRGIRGHLDLRHTLGSAELVAGYIRREDVADEELHPDQIEYSTRNVLVNREPEYGIRLPGVPLGRWLNLRAEWLRGTYSERYSRVVETRARADRDSVSALVSTNPYSLAKGVRVSHAFGWRRSRYSPGEDLTIRLVRHTVSVDASPKGTLSVSYITRRGSGETPFLFDEIGLGRELLATASYQVTPLWGVRVEEVYDLDARDTQDIDLSIIRTAHCLQYTLGWRKSRGSFFFSVGLAPE